MKLEQKLEYLQDDLRAAMYFNEDEHTINLITSKINRLQRKMADPEAYDKQFEYNPNRFLCDGCWKD